MKQDTPLVIIGGGNSGCQLALKKLSENEPFLLFEMNPEIGGIKRIKGQGLLEKHYLNLEELPEVKTNAKVQGINKKLEMVVESDNVLSRVQASKIFLATGDWEVPVPFPGWTIPGVLQSFSAQRMYYRDQEYFGSKVVFLHMDNNSDSFIDDIKKVHDEVITINFNNIESFDCTSKNGKINKIQYCIGDKKVYNIENVDTLIVSSFYLPECDLLQMAGGTIKYNGGFYPSINDEGESSIANIDLIGSVSKNKEEISGKTIDLLKLSNEFTKICRCEGINRIEIETTIESGAKTIDDIKRMSRCGMGPCQWKMCKTSVMPILKKQLNHQSEFALPKLRFPLTPISIDTLSTLTVSELEGVVDIQSNAENQQ